MTTADTITRRGEAKRLFRDNASGMCHGQLYLPTVIRYDEQERHHTRT